MAVDKLVDSTQLDSDLTSVANAIRAKSGGSGQLAFPAGFVSEIGNISGGGGSATLIEKSVNANGTYNASSDSADGYSKVTVNVPNSYAAGDEGKVVSNGALVSQTAHAEVTQNGTIDTTLNNSVTVNVSGVNVTDGIIVKTRNSDGYPTSIDLYATNGEIPAYACYNSRATGVGQWTYGYLESVSLKGASSFVIKRSAFYGCVSLTTFDWDKVTEFPDAANTGSAPESHFRSCKALTTVNAPNLTGKIPIYCFNGCTGLVSVYMPKISGLCGYTSNRGCFGGCTGLQTAEFGSVGYPVTDIHDYPMNGVTQSGLTITLYTTGAYADTALTKLRNGATNATIIIKAAENTTYGGTSYNAGDTLITSTP